MPIYGKGRTTRARKSYPVDIMLITRGQGGKRRLVGTCGWDVHRSTIAEIEKTSGYPIRKELWKKFNKTGKPLSVLDWGCGNGRAATELAKEFGSALRVYGCGDEFYKEWVQNSSVHFIHETAYDSLRYFKNNSLDLVYSHYALHYLREALPEYINKLAPKLKKGGKIIIAGERYEKFPFKTKKFRVGNNVFKAKETIRTRVQRLSIVHALSSQSPKFCWIITRTS